jgi:hypothetical protein
MEYAVVKRKKKREGERDLKSNLRLVVGSFPSPVSNDEEAK